MTQHLFKVEGRPLTIPPRFRPLFNAILFRHHDRVNVVAPTQDGKSMTIAAATTIVAAAMPERFTIVAPNEKKADIIMSEVRELATQNAIIYSQLELDPRDTLDRLKRERSKKNITFKRGGGIMILTLDARNTKNSMKAVMGFGSKNIIADEASLVDDPLWATVVRMLGGDFKHEKRRKILIKVGNPFFRNHFYKSSKNKRYLQVFHNYEDSLRDYEEGFYGYSPEFIEEMRGEALFDIFYDCKFPDEGEVDAQGYRQLVKSDEIRLKTVEPLGKPRLGCDIGGGGDWNVYIIRWDNYTKVAGRNKSKDTMVNVVEIENIVQQYDIKWEDVHIDDIGIGRGVTDRLREKGYAVNGVSVGGKARKSKFANKKAELYWKARLWAKNGHFEPCEVGYVSVWDQLTWIRYKVNTDKAIKIEPKADLKKRKGKSPDDADAFSLTFNEPKRVGVISLAD